MNKRSLIVLSSPSGGGKTTLAKHLMKLYPKIKFSTSATTRAKREGEIDGKDYYFLSKSEFEAKIQNDELIEYEEIFGNYYGTLKSVTEKAINNDELLIFDIDVLGALSIKKAFPDNSLLIFISPPSFEILEERLRNRKTESDEQIRIRLSRAEMEMSHKDKFNHIIVNNDLETSKTKIEEIAKKYL
jgi:guanylate kinase